MRPLVHTYNPNSLSSKPWEGAAIMTDAITCDTALRTQVLHYKKCWHLHIPHLEDCGKAAPDAQTQFFKALWKGRASNIYIIWHQRRTEEFLKKNPPIQKKTPDWSNSFLCSSIFLQLGPLHPNLPDLGANETKQNSSSFLLSACWMHFLTGDH